VKRVIIILVGLLILATIMSGCQLLQGQEETPSIPTRLVAPESLEPPTAEADSASTTPTLEMVAPGTTSTPVAVPEILRFDPGATSATREGRLIAGQVNQFVFSAQAGQMTAIEVSSSDGRARFSLEALGASGPLKTLDDPAPSWQGALPATQQYLITVTSPQATTYTLTLSIDPLKQQDLPVILDPGSPPSDRCVVSHPGGTAVVTVYLGPSTAFAPVAHLGNWAVVLNSENGWQQIQIGPGETGWVRETDVVYSGPCGHANQVIEFELPASGSPYRNIRTILPGQADRYAFQGEAGSRLFVELNSADPVNFALVGVEDGIPLKRVASESRSWEGILPGSQEYMLTVVSGDATADYELLVALVPTLPLVAIYDTHTDALLGGFKDAFWIDSEKVAAELLGGELYDIYQLGQRLGQAAGSAATAIEGICPGFKIQLSSPPEEAIALALSGATWEVVPQLVAPLEPTEIERQALAELLAAQGLAIGAGDLLIQTAYGVDLDGNGLGEVIVGASRLKENGSIPAVDAGDYFVMAVIMDIDGNLHAEPLILDVYLAADDLAYPWRYELSAVLDLNGDGIMEVVLAGTRWEGRSTVAYSVGQAGGSSIILERSCAE
jgi:hypothetical protein